MTIIQRLRDDEGKSAKLKAEAADVIEQLLRACKALVGQSDEGMMFNDRIQLAIQAINKAEGK